LVATAATTGSAAVLYEWERDGSEGLKLKALVVLLFAIGCDRDGPEAAPGGAARDHADRTPVAAQATSAIPRNVLRRANACPFECCVYGEWTADTVIPMYAAPQTRGTPAFTFAKGTRIRADSGVVFVTSVAYAVVDDTVFGAGNQPWLLPNDTVYLLDPVGEGHWTGWRRGEILEDVPPFFEDIPEPKKGRLFGKPGREWWVHATAGGQRGWFPADSVRVRGADACGGPIE
jgi:hypothetical protein